MNVFENTDNDQKTLSGALRIHALENVFFITETRMSFGLRKSFIILFLLQRKVRFIGSFCFLLYPNICFQFRQDLLMISNIQYNRKPALTHTHTHRHTHTHTRTHTRTFVLRSVLDYRPKYTRGSVYCNYCISQH